MQGGIHYIGTEVIDISGNAFCSGPEQHFLSQIKGNDSSPFPNFTEDIGEKDTRSRPDIKDSRSRQ